MLIVSITGMPGAGKSTAAKTLVDSGWSRVVMGDVIRDETRRRGLEPDAKNTGEVMKALRREKGEAAVAELCVEKIRAMRAERVVVDGVRSMAEVDVFRKSAKVLLVAVHASPDRRYGLLKERGRSDDPLTRGMFLERDGRELKVGVSEPIALADEVISNEHSTPESLSAELRSVVDGWARRVGP